MKPISVKFQCFGPYMDKQSVDFTQLEKNGLFLICGETGAGKTTILDAMCIALYGKSSGGTRGELSEMRCKLAGKDDVTEVEFVFENGGRQYKFTRSLKVARKNENEAHQCSELLDGQWVPMFPNQKKTSVNAEAEKIIGLTYDQFRQVIILPQGQFEKLLTSDSQEKEKILATLFHTERLERVVAEVCERIKKRDSDLQDERKAMLAELAKYGCESLEALAEKEKEDVRALEELRVQAKKTQEDEARVKELHQQGLLEHQGFEEFARREEKLNELLTRKEDYDKEEFNLKKADAAEQLREVYRVYEEAKDAAEKAEGELENAQEQLTDATNALAKAKAARDAHEAGRDEHKKAQAYEVKLKEIRPVYQTMAEKKETLDQCQAEWQKADAAGKKAQRDFDEAGQAWQDALTAQKEAREAHQSAQEAYLRSIGGILADNLEPGLPCPVCGSTEHPNPAKIEGDPITDQQLNDLSEAVNTANDQEVKAREVRTEAERAKGTAVETLSQADKALAEAKVAYDQAQKGMVPGIETEEALDAELEALAKNIARFEEQESATQEALTAAKSENDHSQKEVKRLADELEQANKKVTEAQTAWEGGLKESPLETESQFKASLMEPAERQQKTQACAQYKADVESAQNAVQEQQKKLEGKTPPDIKALKEAVETAEEATKKLTAELAIGLQNLETLQKDRKSLTERKEIYDKERLVVDGDLKFADKLRGRLGVSLQRYVLGVKLSAITVAANRLLETVYGGRYRLYRTDEVSGRGQKAGLELEVYDTAQNQRRSVTSLSGGEKFLVALSLAIGLSTVVQASGGGVHMEAMFVDEGFGSLDDNAVDDATAILQGIQQGAGMVVGIISHVSRLEETILTKLEVKKGRSGSAIQIHN